MNQIDELRKILAGKNAEQIESLKKRIEDIDARTHDVGEVLAPAISVQVKQGNTLVEALKAPVSEGLKQSIRAKPMEYAEILYPVMAPSIRRAISQAISSMLVTINQTIESTTSVKGIGLRLQALRSGVPYAQLVLRQSVVFRVEHIYLIDRDSGLLISEVGAGDGESLDSDAVSAMFAAIQSFVQDSFSKKAGDRLTDLRVGEYNVWVAHGPNAMLACVIYGDAPESLKSQLYDVLDGVRTEYSQQLASYHGDNSGFPDIEEKLSPLLQLRLKENELGSVAKASKMNMVLMFLIAAGIAYLSFQWLDQKAKLDVVKKYLKNTPGVVVTSARWDDKKIVIEGLQDPYASIPFKTFKAYGIDRDKIELKTKPFRSLEAEIELLRSQKSKN